MRLRRLSFVAGWAAVVFLAVAGFAAFGTSGSADPDLASNAPEATMGHTAGAYAGLAFAQLAANPSGASIESSASATTTTLPDVAGQEEMASTSGTISDASGWLSQVEVRAMVSRYFKPADVNRAVRVAWCESRFDPSSVDLRTGAVGLFQHLPGDWGERASGAGFAGADPMDPEASTAAAAWALYHDGGWEIFACQG
jgi:Transglycosylase SLT domain